MGDGSRVDGTEPGLDATSRVDGRPDGAPDGPACTPDCAGKLCGASDGCDGLCLAACTDVAHDWSKRIGGSLIDHGYDVAVDTSGNVTLTGNFQGTVDFGGGPLTSAGDYDIFIASYGPDGAHRWSKRFGDFGHDQGRGVAVDASGNVTFTGYFEGTVDFGGGPLASAESFDIFVASYGPDGVHRWSKHFGDTQSDAGYALALDSSGNVTVTGHFGGSVDFGGGSLTGNSDIFIASYGPDGAHRWSKRFGNTSVSASDSGEGVAVDGSGNVTVAGVFQKTVDFGGGSLTSAGYQDVFVASYDSSGAYRWSTGFGNSTNDEVQGVAVDGSGNVTVTGGFQDTIDFGGGPLTSAGSYDIFVASYGPDGSYRWSKRFGDSLLDRSTDVAVDGNGNVVVIGHFAGNVDLGGGSLTSAGSYDVLVASIGPNGAHRWSKYFGGSSHDYGYGVAVDGSGKVAATGQFVATADFGGGPLTSAGSYDIFLVRLSPQP